MQKLSLWLKSDSAVSASAEMKVNQWNDLSGKNNHAIQNDSAKQPVLMTNQLNGKPVVAFDENTLTIANFKIDTTQQITLFIVYQKATEDPSPILELSPDYNSTDKGFILYSGNNKQTLGLNGNIGYNHFTSLYSNKTFYLSTCILDKTQNTNETILRVNGQSTTNILQQVNGTAGELNDNQNAFVPQPLYIGSRGGDAFLLRGAIAEVLLYERIFPMDTLKIVERYLLTKYQLDSNVNISIQERGAIDHNIEVYPNPLLRNKHHSITISSVEPLSVLSVQNALNEINFNYDQNSKTLELKDVAAGVYYIRYTINEMIYCKKLIVL